MSIVIKKNDPIFHPHQKKLVGPNTRIHCISQ